MSKNHLKVQNVPKTWTLKRKNVVFVTRPNPGAHEMDLSMSLNMVLKNLLGKSKTSKESRKIVHEQEIIVNGKRRKDYKYPVGLLDVVAIPKTSEYYVMLINKLNKLYLLPIDKKESETKLSKVIDKKIGKKGQIQLKTLDGRIVAVKKDTFRTGESIIISLPNQEVKDLLKFEKGSPILIYKGKYVGEIAEVVELKGTVLTFKLKSKLLETKRRYAIVIGKDKPIFKIK